MLVKHITVGQVQSFIDIVSYLQFMTGETVLTAESQQPEVYVDKVNNTEEKYIVILACKTYVHAILVGLGEGKELTATLTGICTPEIWKAQYGVKGIYPLSSMSLQDHRRTRNER